MPHILPTTGTSMKLSNKLLSLICCLLPSLVFSDGVSYLNFTVSNLSDTRIYFTSKDLFDFGKTVRKNETKTITYDFPPKIISITMSNTTPEPYEIMTDSSCDILGWPSLRQLAPMNTNKSIEGIALYKAGNVHITISELSSSTQDKKKITCTLVNS